MSRRERCSLRVVVAVGLAAATGSTALAADAPSKDKAAADREACAITVELGRSVLGWGKTPPGVSQFPIFYKPVGDSFVEQCPWAALGVTPLPPGKPDYSNFHYFTEPRISRGGAYAEVHDVTSLKAEGRPPFMSENVCFLKKIAGRWRFQKCEPGAIT